MERIIRESRRIIWGTGRIINNNTPMSYREYFYMTQTQSIINQMSYREYFYMTQTQSIINQMSYREYFYMTQPNPTQPNPTQPNPTQPNPTQPNPTSKQCKGRGAENRRFSALNEFQEMFDGGIHQNDDIHSLCIVQ
jgi:hypothetical protein